jgi:hypothetical protein
VPSSAHKPEVSGAYPELAHLVRQITGNVTRAVAASRSGVSHDTIARLWRGERVSEAILIRFALGYRVDPNPLLRAAGYDPIDTMGESGEIVYEMDPDAIPVPEGYHDVDTATRIAASRVAQEAYRAFVEAVREARRLSPGTFGFGADRYGLTGGGGPGHESEESDAEQTGMGGERTDNDGDHADETE